MSQRIPDAAALIDGRRIVVCVGTGGVGKTTVAASLALAAARRGRRALVLTIDPARRLADALGVEALGNQPRDLTQVAREQLGLEGDGELHALMLDMKRTFDDLVTRFADDARTRDRILENSIYQHLSDALAGSGEYAAMEKVHELATSDAFDLIVVDTPPSQHALDFLDAPQRLVEFLESRLVQMLLHPAFAAGRFGFRLFHRSARRVLGIIERVSGVAFLEDISEFLLAIEGMSEGFRTRAQEVRARLLGADSGFVLVAGPAPEAAAHGERFLDRLEQTGAPLAGIVVNRVRKWPDASGPPEALRENAAEMEAALATLSEALRPLLADSARAEDAAQAAVDAAKGYASLVELDARSTQPLRRRASARGRFYLEIPELPGDVHDLEGLALIESCLCAEPAPPTGEAADV